MKPISAKQQFYCQYIGQKVRGPVRENPLIWTMVLSMRGQNHYQCILIDTAIEMSCPLQLRLPSQMTDDEAIFIAKIAYAVLNVTKTDDATLAKLGRKVLERPHLSARTLHALFHFGIVAPISVIEPGNILRVIEPGEAIAAGWCEVKLAENVQSIQYSNEEYLDLHGHDDEMFPKEKITSSEYQALHEDKRRRYARFCGSDEVYYVLKP